MDELEAKLRKYEGGDDSPVTGGSRGSSSEVCLVVEYLECRILHVAWIYAGGIVPYKWTS